MLEEGLPLLPTGDGVRRVDSGGRQAVGGLVLHSGEAPSPVVGKPVAKLAREAGAGCIA